MEHYRRLGFADKVRAQGLPADYPTDIAYFTRYTDHELARFSLPSARAATRHDQDHDRLVERGRAAAPRLADVRRGRAAQRSRGAAERVDPLRLAHDRREPGRRPASTVEAERADGSERKTLRAAYAMGADGSRSPTRKALGLSFVGEGARGARLHGRARCRRSISAAPSSTTRIPHPRAWMYWTVNRDRRAFMFAVNGRDEFTVSHPAPPGRAPRGHFRRRGARRCSTRALGSQARHRDHRALRLERRLHAGGGQVPARPRLPRRRRRASVHADRRAWLQHRGRGRGQSRLEARRDAQRLGRAGAARQLRDRAAGAGASATPPMRAALRIRSGCSCRPPEIEDDSAGGRSGAQARRRPSQCARARRVQHSRHHVRRPLRRLADHRAGRHRAAARCSQHLRCRPPAPAAARRISGSATAARSTTRSASSSRCCGSAQRAADAAPFAAAAKALGMPLTIVDVAVGRSARSLSGRSRTDPAGPDRGVAGKFSG